MSDLKKLDSFTSEASKNHLIRNFLRNGRLRVNKKIKSSFWQTLSYDIAKVKLTYFQKKLFNSSFLLSTWQFSEFNSIFIVENTVSIVYFEVKIYLNPKQKFFTFHI